MGGVLFTNAWTCIVVAWACMLDVWICLRMNGFCIPISLAHKYVYIQNRFMESSQGDALHCSRQQASSAAVAPKQPATVWGGLAGNTKAHTHTSNDPCTHTPILELKSIWCLPFPMCTLMPCRWLPLSLLLLQSFPFPSLPLPSPSWLCGGNGLTQENRGRINAISSRRQIGH